MCVTATKVQRYIVIDKSEKAANGTINRELHILAPCLFLGGEHKRLSSVHIPEFTSIPEENVREGFLRKADFECILSHLKEAMYVILSPGLSGQGCDVEKSVNCVGGIRSQKPLR